MNKRELIKQAIESVGLEVISKKEMEAMFREGELNKKLAEWAGFTSKIVKRHSADFNGIYYGQDGTFHKPPELYDVELWHDPEMQELPSEDKWFAKNGLPDFTQSLNACFKWLVPKLQKQGIFCTVGAWECSGFYSVVAEAFCPDPEQIRNEESPALALCLAIEKLIDSAK